MKLVSVKKLCKMYGVSKEKVRESIQSNTFDFTVENGETKIDLDSFKKSEYHLKFTYLKLKKLFGDKKEYERKMSDIFEKLFTTDSDEIFEEYYQMYKTTQSQYVNNLISKLEKQSFSKSDYEDYLKSLRSMYSNNINLGIIDTDRNSLDLLHLIIPFVSDEFIEKYSTYYDDNFLNLIIDDIQSHKYLNNKDGEVMNIYLTLLKFSTNKGLLPIIDRINFDEYEKRISYMKSENKLFDRIFSDGDEKFFSHIREMFVF